MKKTILIIFLSLFSILHANPGQIDKLLENIENGYMGRTMSMLLSDLQYKKELVNSKKSAAQIYTQIKREGRVAVVKNVAIGDSLNLNHLNTKNTKLIFINCLFSENVILDKSEISEHLAFLGCQFNKDVHINDLSIDNLTFIANDLKGNFLYSADYKDNQINNFNFILNHVKNFSIEAYNERIYCSYSGTINIRDFMMASNYINNIFLSAITVNELFFIPFNIINKIELNAIKIDINLIIKTNRIASCSVENLVDKEKADIIFLNNSIGDIYVFSSVLRTVSLVSNKFNKVKIQSLFCGLMFRLAENIYTENTEIKLIGNDFAKFGFSNKRDSVAVVSLDTLSQSPIQSKRADISKPVFHIADSTSGKKFFIALKHKKVSKSQEKNRYKFNFSHTIINENNWFVRFKDIQKNGNFYRINPGDSLLANRHEIYTSIQKAYANQGKWNQADLCFYEWKEFERKNTMALSGESFFIKLPKTIFHYLNWVSCGYGIKPLWIFPFAFFIILLFAVFYFFTPRPISNLEKHLISSDKIKKKLGKLSAEELQEIFSDYDFNFDTHKQDLIDDVVSSIGSDDLIILLGMQPKSKFTLDYFWNCFYFSFSTFTTVGIGDWYPSGKLNKTIVMLEGSLGWLCLGLFITTYANILLR